MPDGSSLPQIKISQLPVGSVANLTDQLEANQAGTSRSITVGQVATTVAGTLPAPPTSLPPSGAAGGDLNGSYPSPTIKPSPTNGQVLTTVGGVSTWAAPTGGGGSGTVTSTSVVSANGLAGSVATPSTTPTITLSTTVTGMLKGNGTAISAATAGTDYVTPGGLPTSLPPNGAAAGDLAGSYPNPTIKSSVGLAGSPTTTTQPTATNNTTVATTAYVQANIAAIPAVTIPAGTVAFGGAGGVLTGNSTLTWDNTNKAFGITSYTGAVAGFSLAGSVPASPAVDAFLMSISNPSGNTGNIFRLRAGAAGTTDQFKVDMTGDAACGGSVQALSNSAPPAGGNGAFGIFLGNFSGGNSGLYFGSGAPTFSTFGRYGSLYINTATPGIPYFNNNGTTGWDQLVGLTATQTLTNKTITGYTPTASLPTSLPPNGAAGGALNGTYPNPGIAPSGTNGFVLTTVGGVATWAAGGSGKLLQTVNVETGAVATGTTIIPYDDTIPQITEGTEFMNLAITPQSATSKLIIEVVLNLSLATAATAAAALFQDANANALAAVVVTYQGQNGASTQAVIRHVMTSGTTSATTFRVRAGPIGAQTITFNGSAGARVFGGVMASSIVITEALP